MCSANKETIAINVGRKKKLLLLQTLNSLQLPEIQAVIESCTDILTTSYWLHVELGKKSKKY
jgi:hypothetical protein